MLARQLQNTRHRPFGAGQIHDITEEEFAKDAGCFRWMADEEAAERAAAEAAAKERADREAAQLAESRRYRFGVIKQRRDRLIAQVRSATESRDLAQQLLDEFTAELAQTEKELAQVLTVIPGEREAATVPQAMSPPATKAVSAPRKPSLIRTVKDPMAIA